MPGVAGIGLGNPHVAHIPDSTCGWTHDHFSINFSLEGAHDWSTVGEETVDPARMGTPSACMSRTTTSLGVLPMLNRCSMRVWTVVAEGRIARSSCISERPMGVRDQSCIRTAKGKFVFAERMEGSRLSVVVSLLVGEGEFILFHTLMR